MILEVHDLKVDFLSHGRSVNAVNRISFHINRGEILGIVGESGSGKTVTSLALLGLLRSQSAVAVSGEALFFPEKNQTPLNLLTLDEKPLRALRGREVAMVFQDPAQALNPVFTCGYQVAEALLAHDKLTKQEVKQKVLELFGKVKLADPDRIFSSYPHQLSGGQKQRVIIAMAISCNPSLLIADEPTTALDATIQKNILELLLEIQNDTGMSILFISHDLGVISKMANRVLVMHQGQILEEGNTQNIFKAPQHPYTKKLVASVPSLLTAGAKKQQRTVQYDDKKSLSPLLEINDVNKVFERSKTFFKKTGDAVHAVSNVTFSVYPGETLGLVGESGCGKTTLGRMIMQLTKPSSGEIIFKGKNLNLLTEKELRPVRKSMAVVFQDTYSSLNPMLTIGDSMMEPLQVQRLLNNDRERKQKVMDLLEKVLLPTDFFNRYPHELSSGQRQRICIARALATHPEFIICDEAVSALDASVQAQVLDLFLMLQQEINFACIFISHDLAVVKQVSDRIAVMHEGKIVESGMATELFNHPQNNHTKNLVNAVTAFAIS